MTTTESKPVAVTNAVQPQCGWNTFCIIIGFLNFAGAIVGCIILATSDGQTGVWILIVGLSSGISSLVIGYIVQLLFECRNYLRKLTEK